MTDTNVKKTSRQAKRHKARELVLQATYQWQLAGHDADELERQFKQVMDQDELDYEYFTMLLYLIINDYAQYDSLMQDHLERTLDELDPIELCVLRLAICELKTQEKLPYKVAINEALELTKSFGAQDSFKLVNSVLDNVALALGRK